PGVSCASCAAAHTRPAGSPRPSTSYKTARSVPPPEDEKHSVIPDVVGSSPTLAERRRSSAGKSVGNRKNIRSRSDLGHHREFPAPPPYSERSFFYGQVQPDQHSSGRVESGPHRIRAVGPHPRGRPRV